MKKFIYAILIMIVPLIVACYQDKGNYDYNYDGLAKVDSISFTPQAYDVLSSKVIYFRKSGRPDTTEHRITVNPIFSEPNVADRMQYTWIRSYKWDKKAKKDTITTPGYLDVLIPEKDGITYSVRLEIKDPKTDLAYNINFEVKTRDWYTNSLFILHGNSPDDMYIGNVEFANGTPIITTDAYKAVYPDSTVNAFQKAQRLSFRIDYFNGAELLVHHSDGTAEIWNPYGLKLKKDTYYVIPPEIIANNPLLPKEIMNFTPSGQGGGYRLITGADGRFLVSRNTFWFFRPGANTENTNHLTPDQYFASIGAVTQDYVVFWDTKGKRFILNSLSGNSYPPPFGNPTRTQVQLLTPVLDAHISPDILSRLSLMQPLYAYSNTFNAWQDANELRFLFYDPTDRTNYMCILKTADSKDKGKDGKDDKEKDDESVFTAELVHLPNLGLSPANTVLTYNSQFPLDIIFYAEGRSVYRYNLNNGDKVQLYEAPNGYNVSLLKFRQNDNYFHWTESKIWLFLTIGMNKGEQGAVTELKLNTAGDIDTHMPIRTYEGFKNIVDVQFCNDLEYKIPYDGLQ